MTYKQGYGWRSGIQQIRIRLRFAELKFNCHQLYKLQTHLVLYVIKHRLPVKYWWRSSDDDWYFILFGYEFYVRSPEYPVSVLESKWKCHDYTTTKVY